MSESVDRLKSIGAQKIYEDTHIALKHVHSVLDESFDGLAKVQFIGFISILEREYHLDLSELKERGLAHFQEQNQDEVDESGVFVTPKRSKNLTPLYVGAALVLIVIVALFNFLQTDEIPKTVQNNEIIQQAQKSIEKTVVPKNQQVELNTTLQQKQNAKQEEKQQVSQVLETRVVKIIPKNRLWIGYIDYESKKKKQLVTSTPLELDGSKEWLLSLGHGNIIVEIGDEKQELNKAQSVRFHYKDGILEPLSIAEFKKLNKGRLW